MKKGFLMALALTCLLSVSAFGGDIPSTDVVAPPPHGTTQAASAAQPVSSAALTVIQALIGLLAR